MPDEVFLTPPRADWPALFEREKVRLLAALPARFLGIEHCGSTAVPNLAAKPILDMLGGVASMRAADELLAPLCALGWDTSPAFNATLPDRRFLLRWPNGVRTHHLHLVVFGGETWRRHLAFRDLLRADEKMARDYQDLKYRLAAKYRDDREAYTNAKTDFIVAALRRESF